MNGRLRGCFALPCPKRAGPGSARLWVFCPGTRSAALSLPIQATEAVAGRDIASSARIERPKPTIPTSSPSAATQAPETVAAADGLPCRQIERSRPPTRPATPSPPTQTSERPQAGTALLHGWHGGQDQPSPVGRCPHQPRRPGRPPDGDSFGSRQTEGQKPTRARGVAVPRNSDVRSVRSVGQLRESACVRRSKQCSSWSAPPSPRIQERRSAFQLHSKVRRTVYGRLLIRRIAITHLYHFGGIGSSQVIEMFRNVGLMWSMITSNNKLLDKL